MYPQSVSLLLRHYTELRNLKSANANLQNQIIKLQDIVKSNPNLHSSDEAMVMDTLKRLTRQCGSSQSATDLLTAPQPLRNLAHNM